MIPKITAAATMMKQKPEMDLFCGFFSMSIKNANIKNIPIVRMVKSYIKKINR